MQKTRICAGIIAAASVMTVCACSSALKSSSSESETVMTIDGIEVPYEMYRYAVMMHLRDRSQFILAEEEATAETAEAPADTDGDTVDEKYAAEIIAEAEKYLDEDEKKALADEVNGYALETLAKIYSIFTLAKECGIDPDSENIEKMTDMKLEEIRATYDSTKDYVSTLKLYYMNDSVYRVLTKYEVVYDEIYTAYLKDGTLAKTEDFATEYIKADTGARAKQILISFDRHSESEAKELCESVLSELSATAAPGGSVSEDVFDSFTDKYGEDLYTFKNRDGYYLPLGYYDEAFEETAFSLEIGEISDVIRTSSGYCIVMRCEKDDEYIANNASKLIDPCVTGAYNRILGKAKESADIVTNEKFDKIDIFKIKV